MTIPRIGPRRNARPGAALLLLATSLAGAPAHAAGTDPLRSDACRGAVAALQREESAEVARHADDAGSRPSLPAPGAMLQAAASAPRSCASRAAPTSSRRAAASPARRSLSSRSRRSAAWPFHRTRACAPRPPPSPPAPRRPETVTSCDAGGCWASDGSRLPRVGPVLWGPRGACTVQGASLQCP